MKTKKFSVYFDEVKVNIKLSGVLSEHADACIVPQYPTGISLTGVSAAFIHSKARNSIIAFQDFVRDKKLSANSAFVAACNGDNYHYLIHTPALKRKGDCSIKSALTDTFTGICAALEAAKTVQAQTVVIPSFNTGPNSILSYEQSAKATLEAIVTFSTLPRSLKEITIALKNKEAFEAYTKVFAFTN